MMDPECDRVSVKSSDSVTTSGEYEIVPEGMLSPQTSGQVASSPTLNIANNGDMQDLEKNLTEVIHELEEKKTEPEAVRGPRPSTSAGSGPAATLGLPSPEVNKVGQSIFYDCLDLSPTAEKQDDMKPEQNDTEEDMSEIDQDCTIFSGVTYLGAANINAPKSETEIHRNMSELNNISNAVGLKVSVSIPTCSEGLVVLHDASTNAPVAHYEVHRILFYARGPSGTPDQACFAFTWSHGESQESAVFQCHVFRCHIPEAVNQVSSCFAKAFERFPASMSGSVTSAVDSSMMVGSVVSDLSGNALNAAEYEFIVSLEIREKMPKNTYCVPRDRNGFKLRCNTDKEVQITVKQTPSDVLPLLTIERCFGVLLTPGKLRLPADMQLLDMATMGYAAVEGAAPTAVPPPYQITAEWKASDKAFEQLNLESQRMEITVAVDLVMKGIQEPVRFVIETPVIIQSQNELRFIENWLNKKSSLVLRYYLQLKKASDKAFEQLNLESQRMEITVAVDLVMKGIQEPVRFVIETPVIIQSQNELRFIENWLNKKSSLVLRYYLQLKKNAEGNWVVASIDRSEEIVEANTQPSILRFSINNLSKMVRSTSAVSFEQEDSPTDYSSDGDEPLLSGTGEVSKECSKDILDEWKPILQEYERTGPSKRPKLLAPLVRIGIPEALRGKLWQKLAKVENHTELTEKYRLLITMETKCEAVIQRDIHRTYPAHRFFRDSGGFGQDALYKVSKAYAVYDSEVGYCQGLSYIAASLLLHMPEEEAFCVLVALMYNYGLRDLYKHGFESLRLRLYQLNRLIEDQLPRLHEHFAQIGVETHMFASQWFLTLFTARFPLYFVYHILDVFLLDGMPILFQVAMTLLSVYEQELRQLDFEGVLKYIRVTLPKKCRTENQAKKLMKTACERKVKRLKHYEEEFAAQKELTEREEQETRQYEMRFHEERKKLQSEIVQMQEKIMQLTEQAKVNAGIVMDYKQIIQRQEQQITRLSDRLDDMTRQMADCAVCSETQPNSPIRKVLGVTGKAPEMPLGPLDPLNDLKHQLNTTVTDIQTNRSNWHPWLSKTLNSIQEKVTTRNNLPTFQSYTSPADTIPAAAAMQEKIMQLTEQAKVNAGIVMDYKQIIQRQEQQITRLSDRLDDMTRQMADCAVCSETQPNSPIRKVLGVTGKAPEMPLGPLDPLNVALQRIRELELELAQAKLAQDLKHQLNTTVTDIQTNRSNWHPWLSKTLNSIQEKVTTRNNLPTFQSYTSPADTIPAAAAVKTREGGPKMVKVATNQQQRSSLRKSIDLSPKHPSTDSADATPVGWGDVK
uniref:Putative rab gtpase-activating protein 1-like isoform x1 n=1 Tax=Lutzomyia longipalpis TaxID=7200 RepID=A0A1B0CC10_LUTLO